MNAESAVMEWVTLFGGIGGVLVITYALAMLYYARRRALHDIRVEIQLARIEGLVLGGKRR